MTQKETKTKKILSLFWTFFKIGAFTFGGGYAMVPLIQREIAENKGWITEEDILDIIAIAESTPGPIAINSATFVGLKVAGFWGAVMSTFGVVLPSFVIISVIATVLREFSEYRAVKYAFTGIRAGVLALILKAVFGMYKKCPKGSLSYIVMASSFVLVALLKVNVLYVIIACAVFGLLGSLILKRRAEK
jgi:chromate transporter